MRIFKLMIPVLVMTSCLALSAYAAAVPKTGSVVTHDQITVGDVFEGVTDDANRYLAPAPALGKSMTLGAYDLKRISEAFNLGWTPDGSDQTVTIRRASSEVGRADVQAALEEKMKSEMGGQKFDMELSGSPVSFNVPESTAGRGVTVEKLTYDVAANSFTAIVSPAAQPDLKKEVSGHFYPISQIPVLKEPLRPGDIISKDDIDYVEMRSIDISSSMVTEASSLIGQTPRHGINVMKPVILSDIQMPIIVKKGDLVTMVLKNNALSLTAQGKAMENGAAGDAIHVMNSSSKQVVDAIVTGAQTVSIKSPLNAL
jgi:flagella basal body P-ring formation protein FlgA